MKEAHQMRTCWMHLWLWAGSQTAKVQSMRTSWSERSRRSLRWPLILRSWFRRSMRTDPAKLNLTNLRCCFSREQAPTTLSSRMITERHADTYMNQPPSLMLWTNVPSAAWSPTPMRGSPTSLDRHADRVLDGSCKLMERESQCSKYVYDCDQSSLLLRSARKSAPMLN